MLPSLGTCPPYLTLPLPPQTHISIGLSFLCAPLTSTDPGSSGDGIVSEHVLSPTGPRASDVTPEPSGPLPVPSTGLHTATMPPAFTGGKERIQGGRPFTFEFLTYYRTSCPSTPTSPARGRSWDGRMGIAVRGGLEETEVGTLQAPQDSLPRVTYQFPIFQN